MNKKLFIIAATTVGFAACSNETLIDDAKQNAAEVEIAFNTFAEAQTKATENNQSSYGWNLEDHHETFSVWSAKLVAGAYVPVHGDGKATTTTEGAGVVVTWNTPTTSAWNPASKKYWDKAATSYEFYAAAPSSAAWVINNGKDALDNATTNYQNAYFTINDFTLAGTNLTDDTFAATTADDAYKKSWKGASDVDLMIAAPCTKNNISAISTTADQTVNLQFIHILSRLNVAFKKGSSLADNSVVKVQKFDVCKLVNKGSFDESIGAAVNTKPGTKARWTPSTTPTDVVTINGVVNGNSNTTALSNTDAYYTIQSLVIPQEISFEKIARNGDEIASAQKPYFVVEYTIDDEPFKAYINLAEAFGAVKYVVKNVDDISSVDGLYKLSGSTYSPVFGDKETGETYYEKVANGTVSFTEGWQNNLTVTLDALEILLDATVSEWSTNEEKTFEVK